MSETSFIIPHNDLETVETELNPIKKPHLTTGLSINGAPEVT
jgi:hypothetical protein